MFYSAIESIEKIVRKVNIICICVKDFTCLKASMNYYYLNDIGVAANLVT